MMGDMSDDRPDDRPAVSRGGRRRIGDGVFQALATSSGAFIVLLIGLIGLFLLIQAIPSVRADNANFLTSAQFVTSDATNLVFGIRDLLIVTVLTSFLALLIAMPIALGIALFLTHYSPPALSRPFSYVIDLLAAVPSVVFGLWGIGVLAPAVQPLYSWLVENLGWFPLFSGPVSGTGRTILTAAIVLAVMIIPIITAISREVFLQTPVLHEEAALALGATRWEMIRMAVLPFGRPGIISAAVLGLGRALGETMAVAMVLSATGAVTFQLLTSVNPSTIAANIALSFPEAYGLNVNVLIATGLILFIVTFAVNAIARWIVARRAEFSGAN